MNIDYFRIYLDFQLTRYFFKLNIMVQAFVLLMSIFPPTLFVNALTQKHKNANRGLVKAIAVYDMKVPPSLLLSFLKVIMMVR